MSIRFTDVPEEANVITHSGNFHADDIFSLVLLLKILGNLVIFRSDSMLSEAHKFNPSAIIFDIGYGAFDHHQKGGNGFHPTSDSTLKAIPYASFGLLWKEFGLKFCMNIAKNSVIANKLWEEMENTLVIGIDAIDNGIYPQSPEDYIIHRTMSVSNVISMLNPFSSQGETMIEALNQALFFAEIIFDVTVDRIICRLKGYTSSFQNNPKYFTANTVFSYALLKKMYPNITYEEISDLTSWDNYNYTFHTQIPNNKYISKLPIPTATVGKIWESEGRKYCASFYESAHAEYITNFIRTYFIMGIDAHTNGIFPQTNPEYVHHRIYTIYDFIESLNPIVYSEQAYKDCLYVAVKFALLLINKLERKVIDRLQSQKYVEAKLRESFRYTHNGKSLFNNPDLNILVFDRHVQWQDCIANSPLAKNIFFVISPSNKGGYVIQPVPCKYNKNGYRKGFPSSWYGLHGEELKKLTNIPTANFVHQKNGFIAAAEDLDGAIQMAKKACEFAEI